MTEYINVLKKLSLIGIVFFISKFAVAQVENPCGIFEMESQLLKKDPSILQIREQLEQETQEYIINKSNRDREIYVIPIVFHILHDNGPENIARGKVEACVAQMNLDYSANNDDLESVIPEFEGIIGNATVEFRLAQLDPEGNCTQGITRTHSLATYGAGDNVKYIAQQWDRSKYLNIWVVYSIGSGAAAYAYYPSSAHNNPGIDGIVTNFNYVGNSGSGKHTLSHEVGHYLNLPHTWGSSNNTALPSNCEIDDGVEDTPLTTGSVNGTCNLNQFTCGSLDNVQNIMDYSGCDRMFTLGQVDRMHAALNSTISSRNNLWTESTLIATGTIDGYTAVPCEPIADFIYDHPQGCEGIEIKFAEFTYNSDADTRLWSFPGGTPSESTDSVVNVVYENSGQYTVTLEVSGIGGTDIETKTSVINVMNTYAGITDPLFEGFEFSTFPVNNDDETLSWKLINEGSGNWNYNTDAAYSGTGSIRIKNYLNGDGDENVMISPNIDLRSIDPGNLSFKMAYAKKYDDNVDELRVYLSGDCGISWRLVYAKSGSSLSSNQQIELFVPEPEDWKYQSVNLENIPDWDHMMVKFEARSFGGNCLYIDDMMVEEASAIPDPENFIIDHFSINPNPVNDQTLLLYSINEKSNVTLSITTLLGKTVYFNNSIKNKGTYEYHIDELMPETANGIYVVILKTGSDIKTLKLSKTE